MGAFIEKHSIKFQLGMFVSIVLALVYWTYTASAYVYKLEETAKRVDEMSDMDKRVTILETNMTNIERSLSSLDGSMKKMVELHQKN